MFIITFNIKTKLAATSLSHHCKQEIVKIQIVLNQSKYFATAVSAANACAAFDH